MYDLAGVSATISLLQPDSALASSALHDLADTAIVDVIQPDLPLLAVLLDKGLFDKVAGGLQAQLVKALTADPDPPLLPFPACTSIPSSDRVDARSVLLPATIFLLTAQGCYAQAAALCIFHTHAHPAFANFESGVQRLPPYLTSFKENLDTCDAVSTLSPATWSLPRTLIRVFQSLSTMAAASIERMHADNPEHFA